MADKKINRSIAVKNGTKAASPQKGDNGRPPFEFDEKQVYIFGMYSATQETMAEYYGVSIDTIRRRMQDENSEFCRAYKKGAGLGLMKLREAQMAKALAGDSTMLIWLGKQLLGQKDAVQQDVKLNQAIKLVVDDTDLKA